jgi:hypothetical protein
MIPWSLLPCMYNAAGGSIDLASNRNCGRYLSENHEFFHTRGLRGTRDGCLSLDTAYAWEAILEYRWGTIDVAAGIIKLNISGKEETFTFKPKGNE